MIVKINNQIINVISEDNSYGWNNITTPDTSCIERSVLLDVKINENCPLDNPVIWDCSNIDNCIQTAISSFDTQSYYWMSKTEVTDFLYRFSSWGVVKLLSPIFGS
jgi:hypothetical protein